MEERPVEFPSCSSCKECSLYEQATHPGIPTRAYKTGEAHNTTTALLFVGQAPGYHEDLKGMSWIGWAGQLLGKFIDAIGLPKLADVYLSNIVRCRLPKSQSSPTKSQVEACKPNLLYDIQLLLDRYERVVIMCCGADATKALTDVSSLREAFKMQGHEIGTQPLDALTRNPVLFFTYHPAILYPGRKPQKVKVIQAHFMMLQRYLDGTFVPNKLQVVPELGGIVPQADRFPDEVVCDIETYGILEGREQTVFTPAKSRYIDNIPFGSQVVTVSFGYKEGGRIRTAVYRFRCPDHRRLIQQWVRGIVDNESVLLGSNIKFDVLYLKMNDPILDKLLTPNSVFLDDVLLWAFLLDEEQPEKGLKEQCLLHGITSYKGLKVTGDTGTAVSDTDPDLLYYNCLDSCAPFHLKEILIEVIKRRYGRSSHKLSKVCAAMRNTVLWDTIEMEKAGVTMSIEGLEDADAAYASEEWEAEETARKYGLIVKGEGSRASSADFMYRAVESCGLLDDHRIERTPKKKEIALHKVNRNLVLEYLPDGDLRNAISALHKYKKVSHLRNVYTTKLLTKRSEGIVCEKAGTGYAYPIWYPAPSVFEKGGKSGVEKQGGTIQGRITARKPAVQTFPSSVDNCRVSRFPAGKLIEYDMSQIELRVAALLSGDPGLVEVYTDGKSRNLHTETALLIFPQADPYAPEWKDSDEYLLGKTLNFLVLYRGGPFAFQKTVEEFGVSLSYSFCHLAIETWYKEHPVFGEWQNSLMDTVKERGFLELPTGWSRSFGSTAKDIKAAISTICNFPIQTVAAQISESAHFVILQNLQKAQLQSLLVSQSYDSAVIDVAWGEEETIDEIVRNSLTDPPIYDILKREYNREIPLLFEKKVIN